MNAAMRFRALLLVLLLAALPQREARAASSDPSAAEWQAIKSVVGDQIAALGQDDGPRAFAHASRGLQAQFGDAATFMRMVHAGYQPLIDARYREYLEGAVIDGQVIQPLRLVLPDGTVLVALYTMLKEDDGRWRIAGCMLAPSTVKSA
jgi:hypothetical protein